MAERSLAPGYPLGQQVLQLHELSEPDDARLVCALLDDSGNRLAVLQSREPVAGGHRSDSRNVILDLVTTQGVLLTSISRVGRGRTQHVLVHDATGVQLGTIIPRDSVWRRFRTGVLRLSIESGSSKLSEVELLVNPADSVRMPDQQICDANGQRIGGVVAMKRGTSGADQHFTIPAGLSEGRRPAAARTSPGCALCAVPI